MNRKVLFLVIFGLVIVTALFLVVSVWAYQEYLSRKQLGANISETSTPKINPRDSAALKISSNPEKPSVTTSGIHQIDTTISLDDKMKEYDRLKNELATNTSGKQNSSDSIQQKIAYLEKNIAELNSRNEKVAADNRRLGRLVKEMADGKVEKVTKSPPSKKSIGNVVSADENKNVNISNISLTPISASGALSPSLSASNAEGLQGSFFVKNLNQTSGVFNIVLLLPDGKVLRQSGWETGIFNTPSGKKVYTTQVHLNADSESMQFTVKSSSLTDGIYTLQIYFEGKMLGQLRKRLG
jgi:archaellum component FlaC